MFCQLCRVKAEEGARFCGACGTALGTSSAPQDAISVAERPHPKPKSPGAALLLSLFVPGLGLVYGGKPWWWGLLELLAVLGTACLSWPLAIGFYLFCAIEAYVRVERSGMRCSSCGAELPAFARYCTVCGDARPLPDDSTRPTFENPRTVEVKESKGVSPKTLVLFVAAALITGGIATIGGKVLLEQFRRASGATPPINAPNPVRAPVAPPLAQSEPGLAPAASQVIRQTLRLHDLLGKNIDLTFTDLVNGDVVEAHITKTDFFETEGISGKLIPFSGPNTDCVGFEWQPDSFLMTRVLICEVTRSHTEVTFKGYGEERIPQRVQFEEGDLFYSRGVGDVQYLYSVRLK